jgi:hypothetical protein
MVGHIVAPIQMCTVVRTPFSQFVCNSTADFYVQYIYPTDNPTIDNHIPRIYEELDELRDVLYSLTKK